MNAHGVVAAFILSFIFKIKALFRVSRFISF